jgi:hypothetical protein
MPRMPPFEYDTALPFECKQGAGFLFDDDLYAESPPNSGIFVPYDLTGLTVRFNLARYDEATRSFVDVITHGDAENNRNGDDPSLGHVRYTASDDDMDVDAGDYLAQWDLLNIGGDVVDRVPRGRAYRRVIVGVSLGGPT